MTYQYNGTGHLMETTYSRIDLRLVYDLISDDQNYELLDRFGRPYAQVWDGFNSTSDADAIVYAYDRVSNPKFRDISSGIHATNDKDQAYTYDGLHRLKTMDRGQLVGSTITGTPNREQDFTLDQLGNWATYLEKASGSTTLDQDRTHNAANEISTITEPTGPTWIDPVYNAAGNMTEGPAPGDETTKHKYVYDAWNRLVKITDSSDVSLVEYEYDGLNRRIRKTDVAADPDVDYDYYYNESWQLLEVRKDGDADPLKQHLWHDYYIDALAVTWYDVDVDGADVEELYFTHDANFNVTALVDDTGAVQERYEYETYGLPAILDSDFSDDGDGVSDWEHDILFAGYQYDADAAVYHVRNRVYQPALGRWVQRDTAGYVDGGSLYEYATGSPFTFTDSHGTVTIRGCHRAAAWCLKHDPTVTAVATQLRNNGCNPTITCVDGGCGKDKWRGTTDCDGNVEICAPMAGREIEVCRIMAHELQHSLDICNGDLDCGLLSGFDCDDLACSEIRAYLRSGQCCDGGLYRLPDESYKACIARKATDSMPFLCFLPGPETAKGINSYVHNKMRTCFDFECDQYSPCGCNGTLDPNLPNMIPSDQRPPDPGGPIQVSNCIW